jgi:hypothetical protein
MKLPQLSLRELFLLVVIAAMGCGWWVDRGHNYPAPKCIKWGESVLLNEPDISEVEISGQYHNCYIYGTMHRSMDFYEKMPHGRLP